MIKNAILKASTPLATTLVRARLVPLGLLLLVGLWVNLTLEQMMKQMGPGLETARLATQLSLGLWDMCEGLALFFILAFAIPSLRQLRPPLLTKPFAEPYLGSFFAEYLRLSAQVLLWTLLLILPGLYRYCRLIFVPYIALFSSAYRSGERDALKLSQRMTQGNMALILSVFLATTVAQIAVEFAPHLVPALHPAPFRLIFTLLSYAISIWTFSFLFLLFEAALGEVKDD